MNQLPDITAPAERLPLYDLYEAVKERDRQTDHSTVDLQSYFLLLETLLKGWITSKEELALLCEKLWLKPYHRQGNSLNKVILQNLVNEKLDVYFKTKDAPTSRPSDPAPTTPESKPTSETKPPKSFPNESFTEPDSDVAIKEGGLNLYIADAAAAGAPPVNTTDEVASRFLQKTFLTKGRYFPVNPRRLEQSIRSYRFSVKGGHKTEIDLDATIQRVAKNNFFEAFEYRSKAGYATDWTVLIDQSDSMAAFQPFCDEIARIISDGVQSHGRVLYFKNYPDTHLFYDRQQTRSLSWAQFVSQKKLNVLVVSDAGAARGTYNEKMVLAVVKMLRQLKRHRVAWLNPMPRMRWRKTSAEMIAEFTDMFEPGEGDRDSLSTIVRLFKSKIQTAKWQS